MGALALAGCGQSASQTSVSPTPTWAAASGAPGVSPAATPGWLQYRDATYGFVAPFPSTNATINPVSAAGPTRTVLVRFTSAPGDADRATLEVTATTHANEGLCANLTQGKPVTLSGGVTAYQSDNLSGANGGTDQPQIVAIFTHGGLLTIISLSGSPPTDTFMRRWGGDWGHILAGFQPGQAPGAGQPCG